MALIVCCLVQVSLEVQVVVDDVVVVEVVVEDVVVVHYEGSQVPLVVREDQSLGAAAATWCRAERPKDRHCVRALGVLAATSKLR